MFSIKHRQTKKTRIYTITMKSILYLNQLHLHNQTSLSKTLKTKINKSRIAYDKMENKNENQISQNITTRMAELSLNKDQIEPYIPQGTIPWNGPKYTPGVAQIEPYFPQGAIPWNGLKYTPGIAQFEPYIPQGTIQPATPKYIPGIAKRLHKQRDHKSRYQMELIAARSEFKNKYNTDAGPTPKRVQQKTIAHEDENIIRLPPINWFAEPMNVRDTQYNAQQLCKLRNIDPSDTELCTSLKEMRKLERIMRLRYKQSLNSANQQPVNQLQ